MTATAIDWSHTRVNSGRERRERSLGTDMAYLKSVKHQCHYGGCIQTATKELFNIRNSSHGRFCAKHANIRLASLLKDEQRDRDARADELEKLCREVE